ncbi:MAG: hypothetical protein PVH31_08045 [Ectothiorhodospiraceae bacterium]|jgi:hypothetical protein
MQRLIIAAVLFLALFLGGCGGGGGSASDSSDGTAGSTWDRMAWDQGQWQ